MSDPPTWPPPPGVPAPLSAHDDFLVACVRRSTPKLPVSRLRLVRDLYQETGQDLRSCMAVVNDFCDRHTILMPPQGVKMWLPFFFCGLNFAVILAKGVVGYVLGNSMAAAASHAQVVALSTEKLRLDALLVGVLLVSTFLMCVTLLYRYKKTRAEAAEARSKFTR